MGTQNGCGCGCSGESANKTNEGLKITSRPDGQAEAVRTQVQINGMTCGHCVASVTEELEELSSVSGVDVQLVANGTSTATITSTAALDDAAIRTAIDEAGYDVVAISR